MDSIKCNNEDLLVSPPSSLMDLLVEGNTWRGSPAIQLVLLLWGCDGIFWNTFYFVEILVWFDI